MSKRKQARDTMKAATFLLLLVATTCTQASPVYQKRHGNNIHLPKFNPDHVVPHPHHPVDKDHGSIFGRIYDGVSHAAHGVSDVAHGAYDWLGDRVHDIGRKIGEGKELLHPSKPMPPYVIMPEDDWYEGGLYYENIVVVVEVDDIDGDGGSDIKVTSTITPNTSNTSTTPPLPVSSEGIDHHGNASSVSTVAPLSNYSTTESVSSSYSSTNSSTPITTPVGNDVNPSQALNASSPTTLIQNISTTPKTSNITDVNGDLNVDQAKASSSSKGASSSNHHTLSTGAIVGICVAGVIASTSMLSGLAFVAMRARRKWFERRINMSINSDDITF